MSITVKEFMRELSQSCESEGGQSAWARRRNIPVSQVCETISGKRDPSEAIANALGYIKIVKFERLRA